MDDLTEGAHSRIFRSPFGVVKIAKRQSKRHDTVTQRRIHAIVQKVLDTPTYTILRTPALSSNTLQYEMELVNTLTPLWQITGPVLEELVSLWIELWLLGFAMYDFELYLQPDGKVMILDFDATGFNIIQKNGIKVIHIPGMSIIPSDFFLHPSFPPDFEKYLVHLRLPIGRRNI